MKHPNIAIQPVRSSNVAGVGYDEKTKTLAVHFVAGGQYHYADVPADEFHALPKAPSVGGRFASHIRGKFTGTNLNPKA